VVAALVKLDREGAGFVLRAQALRVGLEAAAVHEDLAVLADEHHAKPESFSLPSASFTFSAP